MNRDSTLRSIMHLDKLIRNTSQKKPIERSYLLQNLTKREEKGGGETEGFGMNLDETSSQHDTSFVQTGTILQSLQ
jgi:hypothetical protein